MKAKRNWLIAGMILGSLLTGGPLLGVLGTVFGMTQAFNALGSSGVGDPQALSEGIGTTLISTAIGIVLFPIGLVMFTLSLIFFLRLRATSPPPLPPPPQSDSTPL